MTAQTGCEYHIWYINMVFKYHIWLFKFKENAKTAKDCKIEKNLQADRME